MAEKKEVMTPPDFFHHTDLARYGKRLKEYLPAVQQITEILLKKISDEPSEDVDLNNLLNEILPALCQVFNSEIAFLADGKGEICYSSQMDCNLINKILPNIKPVKKLIQTGKPLVYKDTSKHFPELHSLNVQSLLVVRLKTQDGLRLVGVANRKSKEELYLSEDAIFFTVLMEIFINGLDYGQKIEENVRAETEREFFSDRYNWARVRGEWEYLSQVSEDYARNLLTLKPKTLTKKKGKAKEYEDKSYEILVDELLTDFLDGKLCCFIQSPPPRTKETKEKKNIHEEPWRIFELLDKGKFKIDLKGDIKVKKELSLETFPRTALALGRICLFADNFGSESVTKETGCDEPETPYKTTSQQSIEELWNKVNKLLDIPELEIGDPGEHNTFHLQLDWLRTKWQQIYYVARQGMLEPGTQKLEEIDNIYKSIHNLSAIIIQKYLENEYTQSTLCVDSDWLISWLVSNVLLSERLNGYYKLNPLGKNKKDEEENTKVNPISKIRYLKHLSHHVLYVLHCARHAMRKRSIEEEGRTEDAEHFKRPPFAEILVDPTSSLSEAQLYIMCEYAYREIGVHRELRIFERLSRQLSYELPLYAASNFYRDHLYHVIDVCLLGELLLRSLLPLEENSNEHDIVADIFTGPTLRGLLNNWYVAALCHDLGYVIEQSDKFLNPISEIKGLGLSSFSKKLKEGLEGGKKEIRETINKIVKSNSSDIPPELACKLTDDIVPTDHGIAAWLHLQQWLKDVKCPLESLAPALKAILRHNLSDQEINLYKEPLSFLLMLCDHIQEWGRPRVGPEPLARGIMESLRFAEKPEFDRKVRMNKILLKGLNFQEIKRENIPTNTCDNCILKGKGICTTRCLRVQTKIDQEKRLEFKLPHVEAREADFEPCISWLMFCRDLQSINCREKELPFQLSIIMEHTPPRIWRALGWNPLEMDIFEEFASTYPTATYLLEWIAFAREKREGIEYDGYRDKGKEIFTIKLHELGKPLSRNLSDEHWKDFFKWKWQWLSHKYTTSNLGTWIPEQKP